MPIYNGNRKTLRFLLENIPQTLLILNSKRLPFNYTPLHEAALRNDEESINLLYKHGANLFEKTLEDREIIDLIDNRSLKIRIWELMQIEREKNNQHDVLQTEKDNVIVDKFQELYNQFEKDFRQGAEHRKKIIKDSKILYCIPRAALYTKKEYSYDKIKDIGDNISLEINKLEGFYEKFIELKNNYLLNDNIMKKCNYVILKSTREIILLKLALSMTSAIIFFHSLRYNEALNDICNNLKYIAQAMNHINKISEIDSREFFKKILLISASTYNMKGIIERGLSNFEINWNKKVKYLKAAYKSYYIANMLDPDNAFIHNNMGWFLIDEFGRINKGLEIQKQACILKPYDQNAIAGLAYAYYRNNEIDKALDEYEKLKTYQEENFITKRYYALSLIRNSDYDAAIAVLNKILDDKQMNKYYVNYYMVYQTLALAYYCLGKYDICITNLNYSDKHCKRDDKASINLNIRKAALSNQKPSIDELFIDLHRFDPLVVHDFDSYQPKLNSFEKQLIELSTKMREKRSLSTNPLIEQSTFFRPPQIDPQSLETKHNNSYDLSITNTIKETTLPGINLNEHKIIVEIHSSSILRHALRTEDVNTILHDHKLQIEEAIDFGAEEDAIVIDNKSLTITTINKNLASEINKLLHPYQLKNPNMIRPT